MPKSHFPARGGAHPQPRYGGHAEASGECERCKEKSTELDRMRQELSRLRKGGADGAGGAPSIGGPGIMWFALGVVAIGLLFAIAVVMRHG